MSSRKSWKSDVSIPVAELKGEKEEVPELEDVESEGKESEKEVDKKDMYLE